MDDQFSGGGQVRKTGSGTWIVTGANTYRGGTKVLQGRLEVSNRLGSGTGTGPVLVRHGGLGGRGIIGGPVTVGDGTTRGAVLNPGRTATQPQTLTITNILTLNSNASYSCALNSNTASADQVAANGVTINEGALVALGDSGGTALLPGTAFTIINNTGITAIFGTFINLPDGGTITIGSNTFQANYEGGDGNDLTLTVVQ
jgi:autotransporter-associated beta strand protein